MFCPNCGAEELNRTQFCRGCGTELQAVRVALEQPDAITPAAVAARKEISRAIAAKIAELDDTSDLKTAVYEILPVIEAFMQSPEERRLAREERRLQQTREGVLTVASGLGVLVFFLLMSFILPGRAGEIATLAGVSGGVLVLIIGLGIIANAKWFTAPAKLSAENSRKITNRFITGGISEEDAERDRDSGQPQALPSVTEGTTRQL
ncbi:MAG TPA: zinc ribbon domain-containing protein [Blastocatellia bacterium]|nr:zinc ribbon domain-containing protein [Blastocatellia bacterium]